MKNITSLIFTLIAFQGYGQWQYINPTSLSNGSGSSLLQTSVVGRTGGNNFYGNNWLYGTATTNDWTTTKLIDGISIDASYVTPTTARSWWLRDPYNNVQSWGDQGNTYLTINQGNFGIGTTSPDYRLHIEDGAGGAQLKFQRGTGLATIVQDNNTNDLYIDASSGIFLNSQAGGNVGIGTPSPDMKLSIYGADQFITRFHSTGTQAITGVRIGKNSSYGDLVNLSNGFGIGAGTTSTNLPLDSQNPNYIYLFVNNSSGNVGIGTTSPDAKLAVSGQVHAQEVKVSIAVPGPDYVFEKDYPLTSLEDIKTYIDQNKHLPEVPSAKEMEKNGVQLGEMNMLLLKKIEELTLYVIEQNRNIAEQNRKIEWQGQEINTLKNKIK